MNEDSFNIKSQFSIKKDYIIQFQRNENKINLTEVPRPAFLYAEILEVRELSAMVHS